MFTRLQPSTKSKLTSKQSTPSTTNKNNSAASSSTSSVDVTAGSSAGASQKEDKATTSTSTDTSPRDDIEKITLSEDIKVSVDGEEKRDEPPTTEQQQDKRGSRDDTSDGEDLQQPWDESPTNEQQQDKRGSRDSDNTSDGEDLREPYIVRRKSQQSLGLVPDAKYSSGELMIDPSAPPPAWCANILVTGPPASNTTPFDLMTSVSDEGPSRPSSPPNLRVSRSEECYTRPSKRGSAKKNRAKPSPEMGMRPPRWATASSGASVSSLKDSSPKPEGAPKRSATDTSPVPSRIRMPPKPLRPPPDQSVLRSLVKDSKGNAVAVSEKPKAVENKVKRTTAPAKESPFSLLDRAVIKIQSVMRGHLAREQALIRMGSIVMIQSAVRRRRAVVEGYSRRGAIVSIQAWHRGELVRTELEYLRWCAIQIQTPWRQHLVRQDFKSTKAKVMLAQTFWRGRIAKKRCRMRKEQITKIQALARRRAAEKNLKTSQDAATSIQASARGATCRRKYKELVIQAHRNAAASTIQASFRGATCRRQYKKAVSSAILIQSVARKAVARAHFIATVQAVVRLQALAKKVVAQSRYQSVIVSVTGLQAMARRITAQRRYHATRKIAIVSQSFARQVQARREYLVAIKAVVLLQSTARMTSEQKKYSRVVAQRNQAAVVVQSCWRRFVAQETFEETLFLVVHIQLQWRRHQAICELKRLKLEREQRIQREREEREREAATLIQSTWRGYYDEMAFVDAIIAATIMQAYTRRYICQRNYTKQLEILREEQERERQREAEREALRRSAMAAQRRKLQQERLEAERLRREERERNKRLEQERRNEKERALMEAERIREEEKEKQNLDADIVAELEDKETRNNIEKKSETESHRRSETHEHPARGPMSPPKKSVVATGASSSIKDRIRMFSAGGSAAVPPSPASYGSNVLSPMSLGRSFSFCSKSTFREGASKQAPAIQESIETPASPKASQAKAASSPVRMQTSKTPVRPSIEGSDATAKKKYMSPPRPVRRESTHSKGTNAKIQPVLSPSGGLPSEATTEDSNASLQGVSPRQSQTKASSGNTFDFNQLRNRFDTGRKVAIADSFPRNDKAQKPSNPRSPQFQRQSKSKVVEWEAPQMVTIQQVEMDDNNNGWEGLVVEWETPQMMTTKQVEKHADEKMQTEFQAVMNDNNGWEDFGATPSFTRAIGGAGWMKSQPSPRKQPQPLPRKQAESCPDEVLESFQQIKAKYERLSSPTAKTSPKVALGGPNDFTEPPSNTFKLRPSQKDTRPTVDQHTSNQLPSPSSRTKGKTTKTTCAEI